MTHLSPFFAQRSISARQAFCRKHDDRVPQATGLSGDANVIVAKSGLFAAAPNGPFGQGKPIKNGRDAGILFRYQML
jgi:hypothetical protein